MNTNRVSLNPDMQATESMCKFYSEKDFIALMGISRTTAYNKANPKSRFFDKDFPTRLRVSRGRVGYSKRQVDAWIQDRQPAHPSSPTL